MDNKESIECLKALEDYINFDVIEGYDIHESFYLAIKALENERPQGEWKIYKSPVDRYYQCSRCGKNSPDFTAYMKMNFCPNCGADMREADK